MYASAATRLLGMTPAMQAQVVAAIQSVKWSSFVLKQRKPAYCGRFRCLFPKDDPLQHALSIFMTHRISDHSSLWFITSTTF